MKVPSKLAIIFLALASPLGGVALAAYELNTLHGAVTAGRVHRSGHR